MEGVGMKLKTPLIAAIGLAVAGAATAQDLSLADDARMVRNVTLGDLEALALSLDHNVLGKDAEGVTVSVEDTDGLKYLMDGTACDEFGACLGINMIVQYNVPAGMNENLINQVDVKYAATSIWTNDNTVGISRYIILDGGMTMENLKVNVKTLLAIAPKVDTFLTDAMSQPSSSSGIDFGDDSGSDANDGVCDDGRFHPDGDEFNYTRRHVMRDATDCRAAYESGIKTLTLDFGDDSGDYALDGECDDNRFSGDGRSMLTTNSQIKKDASDCIAAYQEGRLNR